MISAGVMVMGSLSLWSEPKSPSPDPTSWWMCNLNPWTGSSSPRRSDPRRHSGHLWHAPNRGTPGAFRRHGGGDSPRDDRDAGSGDGPGGRGELSGGEYELRGSERGER